MSNARVLLYEELRPIKGVPYSRQWISRLERNGQWPRRVALGAGPGGHRVGWFEHEIDQFLLSLPRGSISGLPDWLARPAAAAAPEPEPEPARRAWRLTWSSAQRSARRASPPRRSRPATA